MQKPIHPLVAEIVGKLDADLCEEFEERAGIIQFDAKLPRDHSECLALLDVLNRHPDALLMTIGDRLSWHSVKRKNLWKGAKPFLPLQGEGQDGDGVKI